MSTPSRYYLNNLRTGETYPVGSASIVIGRSATCDIPVDSGLLSRKHALIVQMDSQQFLVKDLDSTNGTFVNSDRLNQPRILRHGDELAIGDERFIFVDNEKQDDQYLLSHDINQQLNDIADNTSYGTMMGKAYFGLDIAALLPAQKPLDASVQWMSELLNKKPLDANRTPAVLLVRTGSKQNSLIELKLPKGAEKEWSLGRHTLCDVVLSDPTVSSQHASIRWENGFWILLDNKSTNGISLNGKKITQSMINSGDDIVVGNVSMIFRVL